MIRKPYKLPGDKKISDGLKVPENYFETLTQRTSNALPFNQAAETTESVERKSSWWQKSRPFVYMAAMFAGIWCMTQMFSLMKNKSNTLDLENNAIMSEALANNEFVDDYIIQSIDEYELMEQLYDEGYQFEAYH